ncbi:MAG: deiodinase-like protein [Acidimicrobiales bacterium]
MNQIYQTYNSDIDFLCVYIREAHPEDNISGRRAQMNADAGIFIDSHTTIEERADAAQTCVLRLNLKMPMALDDMTDQVDKGYRAMPERLAIVDAEGKLAFISGQGPWGFEPDDWEAAMKQLIT